MIITVESNGSEIYMTFTLILFAESTCQLPSINLELPTRVKQRKIIMITLKIISIIDFIVSGN
jgi:hypothetical protein